MAEKAKAQQREALTKIVKGEGGGRPFEVFTALFPKMEVQYVPFEFNINGKNSSAKMGDAAAMAFEPISNPVTGDPEAIRIEHETGFIFQGADVVSAKECRSSLGGDLGYSWPDKAGFVTQVKYGN